MIRNEKTENGLADDDAMNMAATVLRHAVDLPDKTALQIIGAQDQQSWSYAELETQVRKAGGLLVSSECRAGDRIILSMGNITAFPISFLACLAADLVPVVTSALLTDVELAAVIREVSPSLMISSIRSEPKGSAFGVRTISSDKILSNDADYLADYSYGNPDRLAYIVYTSGSSGTPKAVCHAHRVLRARRLMWDGWYELRQSDKMFHAGAFNWTFTLGTGLLDPWSIGATSVIPESGTTPEDLAPLIAASDPTLFAAAPALYRKLLIGVEEIECPSLRHGLSAGEKMPGQTRQNWEHATGTKIHEAFGMSECSTFISGSPSRPAPETAIGYPQPGRRIAILDEKGNPTKPNESGTIAISSNDPGLMLGYWSENRDLKQNIKDGWFLTGDLGHVAEDGAIYYDGRVDDMMNPGGVRVAPAEVEKVLSACDGIEDCAVTDVEIKPDVKVIAAFYVCAFEINENRIREQLADRLAAYKQPRVFVRLDQLPRNTNGKIQRKILRDMVERNDGKA